MSENYTKQTLPTSHYRELLGTALCAFNSTNAFMIENILRYDDSNSFNWYQLIDWESGVLKERTKNIILEKLGEEVYTLFDQIVNKRNRIIHSFQITNLEGEQVLQTKTRAKDKNGNIQTEITEEYLLNFIRMNDQLSGMLHQIRDGKNIAKAI